MLGCIIPEPLHIAPMRHCFPDIVNSTAISFLCVSVVIMAFAASSASLTESDNFPDNSFTPATIFSIGSCGPMTPVEPHITYSDAMPVASLTAAAVSLQFSKPFSPVAALAIPVLTTTACASFVSFTTFISHLTGAAFTLFLVNVPTQVAGTSLVRSIKSLLSPVDFIPTRILAHLYPFAAVTPPFIIFIFYYLLSIAKIHFACLHQFAGISQARSH